MCNIYLLTGICATLFAGILSQHQRALFVTESALNILTTSAADPFFLNTKDPNFDSIYSIVRTAELVGTTIDFCYLPQDHSILGMSLNRMS